MGIKIDDLGNDLNPVGASLLSGNETVLDNLRELSDEELKISGGGKKGGETIIVTGGCGYGGETIVVSGGGKKGGGTIVVTGVCSGGTIVVSGGGKKGGDTIVVTGGCGGQTVVTSQSKCKQAANAVGDFFIENCLVLPSTKF